MQSALLLVPAAEGAAARLGPAPRVGAGQDRVTGSRDSVAGRSPDCGEDAGDGGVLTAERKRPRPVAPDGCDTVDRS